MQNTAEFGTQLFTHTKTNQKYALAFFTQNNVFETVDFVIATFASGS